MDYKNLKDAIKAVIKENGAQEITGQIMQDSLLSIVSKLGGNKTFAGVASPATVPDTTDANIFYIAGENGTYVNFGGAKVENEAAVFVQAGGGTWRAIYTGIQTSHGVNNQLQQEHEYFETEIDNVSADLTQFKQTEFTDVKEDVERHTTEIAKNKSDITNIKGEIATLNEATNTAADELVRIEEKIDKSLEDTTIIFFPTVKDGILRYADIIEFNMSTNSNTIKTYFDTYWEVIETALKNYKNVNLKAYYGNEDCSSGLCKPATEYGNIAIDLINYKIRSNNLIEIEYGFIFGGKQKHFNARKNGGNYNITEYGVKRLKINENSVYAPTYCNGSIIDLNGLINTEEEFETACANSAIVSDANIHTIFTVITKGNAKKLLIIYNYASVNEEYTYQEYHKGAQDIYVRGLKCSHAAGGALDWPVFAFKWETYGVQKITYNNSSKNIIISNYFSKEVSKTGILPFSVQANSIATLEEPIIQ